MADETVTVKPSTQKQTTLNIFVTQVSLSFISLSPGNIRVRACKRKMKEFFSEKKRKKEEICEK